MKTKLIKILAIIITSIILVYLCILFIDLINYKYKLYKTKTKPATVYTLPQKNIEVDSIKIIKDAIMPSFYLDNENSTKCNVIVIYLKQE